VSPSNRSIGRRKLETGNSKLERQTATTLKGTSAPLQRDVPGTAFFLEQASRQSRRCEECRYLAIHGDTLCNRVPANVVGRRGRFPQGAILPRFLFPLPLVGNDRTGARGSRPINGDLRRAPEGRCWGFGAGVQRNGLAYSLLLAPRPRLW
jgi:hypothetical protein